MNDGRIQEGFLVIGNNTSNGALERWYFPDLEMANAFAKVLCEESGEGVDVTKKVGRWSPPYVPATYIAAPDYPSEKENNQPRAAAKRSKAD